jgi:hypothetical protein
MATTGGGAAYQRLEVQRLEVPKDGIGQAMQYWGGIQAQRRADQEEAAAKKKAAEDVARKEAYKATRVPDDAFRTMVTGFDNRDDIARNFASKAMEGYTKSANLAREAWDRGDKAEYQRYLDNMDKTLGEFDNFTNNEEHLKGIAENYATLAREGKLNPVDEEYEQFMEAFTQNNFEYYLDDNNIPHVRALLKDEEGNEYVKEVRASDLVNGNYRPYENVVVTGKGGLIDEMLVGFGKRVYDENTGNYIHTTQKWDEKNQASLEAKLKALTGDKRTMSSLLYQASGTTTKKMGDVERNGPQDAYTKKDIELVNNWITKQVEGAYGEKDELTHTGAATKAMAAKKKELEDVVEAEPMTDEEGDVKMQVPIPSTGDAPRTMDVRAYTLRTKSGKPITGIMEEDSSLEILSIAKYGDEYFVEVRSEGEGLFEEGGAKTVKLDEGSTMKTELNRLARAMNLPTAGDMDKYLEGRRQAYLKRTGQKKATTKKGQTQEDPLGIL